MKRFVLVARLGLTAITWNHGVSAQSAAAPAESPPPRIAAAAFANSGGISDPILSPDGKRIAITAQIGGKAALAVLDTETRKPVRRFDMPPKHELEWYKWAGSERTRVTGEAAKFDLDLVSPLAQVGKLTRPVLLTHGDEDTNVPFRQYTLYRDAAAKAGKQIETVVFPGEGHGFSKPENEQKWYEALDAFLAKYNPA